MRILGIDTSTKYGNVAVIDETQNCEISEFGFRESSFSKQLLKMIDLALGRANLGIEDIGAFAVAVGPGSYTGLRIGISLCKGFCFGTNKPIAGIETLEMIAFSVTEKTEKIICPLLDARENRVHAAFYRYQGNKLIKLSENLILPINELCKLVKEETIFLGEGTDIHKKYLQDNLNELASFLETEKNYATALSAARLGKLKIERGEKEDLFNLKPEYGSAYKINMSSLAKGGI